MIPGNGVNLAQLLIKVIFTLGLTLATSLLIINNIHELDNPFFQHSVCQSTALY